jgi:hypothetical protein
VEFATTVVDTGCKFATGVVDTGGAPCHWYQQHQRYLWQFTMCFVDTSGKFANFDIGSKFATGVVDTGGAPGLANISPNFLKNVK